MLSYAHWEADQEVDTTAQTGARAGLHATLLIIRMQQMTLMHMHMLQPSQAA